MELAFNKLMMMPPIKKLEDAKRVRPGTGTYEFVYEEGKRAQKLFEVLSDPGKGYRMAGFETLNSDRGYSIERYIFKEIKSNRTAGELEVKREANGSISAAYLHASNREISRIAEIALSALSSTE